MYQYIAFAFGVPHDINGFHPYTVSSIYLLHPLSHTVSHADLPLGDRLLHKTNMTTYTPFTPNNSG